jgi:AmmeMemoRadiSam system protein B
MPEHLPRLRFDIEFLPSPVAQRPGLMLRDPFGYSDSTLIIPPALIQSLRCFDGEQTDLDLRQMLTQSTGELEVGDLVEHLITTLDNGGFLLTQRFEELRDISHRQFAESPVRLASHAGAAYPDDESELRELLTDYLSTPENGPADAATLVGIAAPHISPEGGWETYREAFRALSPNVLELPSADRARGEKVFIILGTSHYGEPGRFGLTRKNFLTPLGEAHTETAWVDWLAQQAPDAVLMEDYCHAVEHSIEFQVVFLQSLFGPSVRILPILCGSFALSMSAARKPEDDDAIRAFLESLGALVVRERTRPCFVLGADMAHMGRRYGDRAVRVGDEAMGEVAQRDHARIARLSQGDAEGFWDLVRQNEDDLKWCGTAPFYTFLRAAQPASGLLRRYQQWNIDDASVVSFAAMAFHR